MPINIQISDTCENLVQHTHGLKQWRAKVYKYSMTGWLSPTLMPKSESSMLLRILAATLIAAMSTLCAAQSSNTDVADQAIAAAFGRDNRVLLCLDRGMTHRDIRARLNLLLGSIDPSKEDSFHPILAVIYAAFPCPFSPSRPELERATPQDVIGRWLFAQPSMVLRYGPNSPAWRQPAGVPPITCETILIEQDGAYRVMQVLGTSPCPENGAEVAAKFDALPLVSSWKMEAGQRLRVDRSDVPNQFEEWDVFTVKTAFAVGQVKFNAGELVAYLRRAPRNEIGAATMFRHLQRLQ